MGQVAETIQQLARQIDCALARHPGTQKDRQQLGIGQCRGPALQQFLSGPFARRPIHDTHLAPRLKITDFLPLR